MAKFEGLGAAEQLQEWERVAQDPRPRTTTGIAPLDRLLNRESFGPGELVVLGGRMHTRKTTVMVNLIVNMLKANVPVGLVALDEGTHSYVAKIASAMSGVSHVELNELMRKPEHGDIASEYRRLAKQLSITRGYRPDFPALTSWLDSVLGERPRVVFIDYLSLLAYAKYSKGNTERIQKLIEDLQVWTNEQGVTTVVLHQVGRSDDTAKRYHGDSPMTPEQLMYGGEQAADIILSTFRPALNPIGNMTERQALAEGIEQDEWEAARDLVDEYRDITMLQVTKNRPGVELLFRGIPLRSRGFSQRMDAVEDHALDADGVLRSAPEEAVA